MSERCPSFIFDAACRVRFVDMSAPARLLWILLGSISPDLFLWCIAKAHLETPQLGIVILTSKVSYSTATFPQGGIWNTSLSLVDYIVNCPHKRRISYNTGGMQLSASISQHEHLCVSSHARCGAIFGHNHDIGIAKIPSGTPEHRMNPGILFPFEP